MATRSVIPWTWSSYEAYQQCPKQFYEMRLARTYPQTFGVEQAWGKDAHDALKLRVADGMPLADRFKTYEPMAAKLAAAPGNKYCEIKLAVNNMLQPCDYWDDNVWNRGDGDLVIINGNKALSVDYKTGKKKDHSRQLELDACRVMANFPEVEVVHTAFAWLQTGEWTQARYGRPQLQVLWEGFFEGVTQMIWSYENNVWPAKPSGLCRKSKKPGSTYAGCPVANCPHSEFYRK